MHLIINSLDTRRWMSDGVSPAADGEQRDGVRRGEGEARGLVCCRSKYGGLKREGERGRGRGREKEVGGENGGLEESGWDGGWRMRERGSAWGR